MTADCRGLLGIRKIMTQQQILDDHDYDAAFWADLHGFSTRYSYNTSAIPGLTTVQYV